MNGKGEVLSDSYVGSNYVGPYKVMDDLKKLLTGDSAGVARADIGTPPPVAAASNQPARQTTNSPSGTNWDEVFKKKSP